jgi:hypothetical protein
MTEYRPDWVGCFDCLSVFFNGHRDGNRGECAGAPAGRRGHQGDGFVFVIEYYPQDADPQPDRPDAQSNWRNCWKCQALFYDGMDPKGVCPAGGVHDGHADEALYNFVLFLAGPALNE